MADLSDWTKFALVMLVGVAVTAAYIHTFREHLLHLLWMFTPNYWHARQERIRYARAFDHLESVCVVRNVAVMMLRKEESDDKRHAIARSLDQASIELDKAKAEAADALRSLTADGRRECAWSMQHLNPEQFPYMALAEVLEDEQRLLREGKRDVLNHKSRFSPKRSLWPAQEDAVQG